jgi:hypothetical protein
MILRGGSETGDRSDTACERESAARICEQFVLGLADFTIMNDL